MQHQAMLREVDDPHINSIMKRWSMPHKPKQIYEHKHPDSAPLSCVCLVIVLNILNAKWEGSFQKISFIVFAICRWVKLEENFPWKTQFIHHLTGGRVFVGHCHLPSTGEWVCFVPSPPTNIPGFSCWEEGSEWQLGGGKRGTCRLENSQFYVWLVCKWASKSVPRQTHHGEWKELF